MGVALVLVTLRLVTDASFECRLAVAWTPQTGRASERKMSCLVRRLPEAYQPCVQVRTPSRQERSHRRIALRGLLLQALL